MAPKTAAPDPLAILASGTVTMRGNNGPRCMVADAADKLTPEQRANFATALSSWDVSAAMILDALAHPVIGIQLGRTSVERHRSPGAGACSCWLRPDGWAEGRRPARS